MKVYPNRTFVWGGVSLKSRDALPAAAQVLDDLESNAAANDPDSMVIIVTLYEPSSGGDMAF